MRHMNAQATLLTLCFRGLMIIGLCLFIWLTLYVHNDDSSPLNDDAGGHPVEVISNSSEFVEPAYYKAIKDASVKYELDPNLIATIIYVESGGNVFAVSPRGAKGLMQLTPAVYRQYNVGDPFDIEQNIFGGTAHLAFLLRRFDGNLEHALAAYNCGPTRVIEYKGIPPIRETRVYVDRIMGFYLRGEVPTGFINEES
jgi:soluble lytic murein transglycosylase-like protein